MQENITKLRKKLDKKYNLSNLEDYLKLFFTEKELDYKAIKQKERKEELNKRKEAFKNKSEYIKINMNTSKYKNLYK